MKDLPSFLLGAVAGALLIYYVDSRSMRAWAAPRDRRTLAQIDEQLHDRVRARLDRLVSHPGAVEVQVSDGIVCLRGHVLTRECAALEDELRQMVGVQAVRNELQLHDAADGVPELAGGSELPRGSLPVS